ncbi:MAG: polysaccharide biosynthesis C-terminal domain-containing protein, partial [Prolixibacteraceae bacterium]|nr:polysaccharide biosynthesis C-terminal domain-containing protein [Prolixibacteraceae bacterium]
SFTAILFLLFVIGWKENIANAINISGYSNFIVIMGITVAFDVISTIPFAKLRLEHKPMRFASIKFINIGINIGFNLFFLSLCPVIAKHFPESLFTTIYDPSFGIGYVFLSNLIASVVTLLLLFPQLKNSWNFDFKLLKKMITYSFPIVIVGITGMINLNIDKILLPKLLPASEEPMKQLGIYVASFKMAVILNMFIQAFRYAFEPFFFSQKNKDESKQMYVIVMQYFVIFGLIIFLGLSTFIDIFKFIVAPQYREGIGIVPIVLMANLFMGIYFTLSLWYKLTDKTKYGAYMGIMGSAITLSLNFILIPVLGYYASAWAILACFVTMTVVSYLLGKKYYPVPYKLKNFFFYLVVSVFLFAIYWIVRDNDNPVYWLAILVNIVFIGTVFLKEKEGFKALFKK